MKKALAIISAVALVGVAAFAEDAPALKLSGYVDTGIKAVSTDSKTASDTVQLWGDDSGSTTRFDLNGTYTNGNAGVDFKLRTQDLTAPAINHFEAWTLLADGKVKLVAGLLDTSAWKTEGDDGFTAENGTGIQVQIIPVAGLNVGVKFNTNSSKTETPTQFFNELGFGGKYTTDLFNVAAGYTLDSDVDDANAKTVYAGTATVSTKTGAITADSTVTASDYAKKEQWAYAGINFKGIAKTKLIAEAKFSGLGNKDISINEFDEIVEYAVSDPLYAGILCYQYIPGASGAKPKMSFKPYVGYTVNSMVKATGEVKYTINDDYTKDVSTFYVKPGVELTVSPNSKILINDCYQIQDINKKGAYNVDGGSEKALNTNTINVNFRFNF